jgi:hypothetical protein
VSLSSEQNDGECEDQTKASLSRLLTHWAVTYSQKGSVVTDAGRRCAPSLFVGTSELD